MPQQYVYKLVREDWITGERARRPKTIIRDKPDLRVGGLYVHLGKGYPGCQRVVSVTIKDFRDTDAHNRQED